MPDENRPSRAALLSAVRGIAIAATDPSDVDLGLLTTPGADLSETSDRAFVLGWVDPHRADVLLDSVEHESTSRRLLLTATLLGVIERLTDVVAAALADDPRGIEPVHQMLGARLADHVAMASALAAALDDLAVADPAPAVAAAPLLLAYEEAVSAAESASLAAPSADGRRQIGDRREWLSTLAHDGGPLRWLDEVASDLELTGSP